MSIGVRTIIKKGDSIVMVGHKEKEHGNFMLFPGGGIEKGESIFQAAEREVMEETKLIVKASRLLYVREVEWKGDFGVEFYVLCEYVSGSLELGHDPEHDSDNQVLTSAQEIPLNELDNYDWKPEELRDKLSQDLQDLTLNDQVQYLGIASF